MTTEPRPLPPVARCSDDDWNAYLDGAPVAITRDVVEVEGVEAGRFLQAMLSQDVATLAVGESRWAMLLQPTGKLVAHLRVTRLADLRYQLDTDPGAGAEMSATLRRFLLRTKAVVAEACEVPALHFPSAAPSQHDGARTANAHPLLGGVDAFGATDPDALGSGIAEVERILAGLPRHPNELDADTIPNSTGLLPWAVSFTKGCYPGQELVARIDARGATTPTRLVRITAENGSVQPGTADALSRDGIAVGVVTSLARCEGALVGLAWVQRGVDTRASLQLGSTSFEVLGDVGA